MNSSRTFAVSLGLLVPLLAAGAARADIITQADNVLVQSWQGNAATDITGVTVGATTPAPPGNVRAADSTEWYNTIGPATTFDTTQLQLERNGVTTIRATTNLNVPNTGATLGGRTVLPADLVIDLDGDGIPDYGIATTTRTTAAGTSLTAGTLYVVTGWQTSQDIYSGLGSFYGGRWDECTNGNDCNAPKLANSLINTVTSNLGLGSVTDSGAVVAWVLPAGVTIPDGAIIYWGTADCFNDGILLRVPVAAEPVSLSLFGAGLLALGVAARRRRRP